MSNCPFCNLDETQATPTCNPPAQYPADPQPPMGLLHRAWRTTQWLAPAITLVFMPKCPMCIAAYVALFTGIGITAATARWIYVFIPVLCLTSLAILSVRYCHKRLKAHEIKTV